MSRRWLLEDYPIVQWIILIAVSCGIGYTLGTLVNLMQAATKYLNSLVG